MPMIAIIAWHFCDSHPNAKGRRDIHMLVGFKIIQKINTQATLCSQKRLKDPQG